MRDDKSYDIWAARINENIRAKNKKGTAEVASPKPPPLKKLLLEFAQEAATIVGAIGRNIDAVEITGGELSGYDGRFSGRDVDVR